MNQIEIFNSPEFGSIRTLEQNGKVLFCGTDVATALGYTNPRKAVRDHTRGGTKCSIGVQTGKKADGSPAVQMVEMLFIPEGDLYRLIAHSKLPSAERFEQWVFDEVLPVIRKHGAYLTKEKLWEIATSPEALIKLCSELLAEREENASLREENALLESKAAFYDLFIDLNHSTNLRTTAKELLVPERRFVRFLLEKRFVYRTASGNVLPYAKPANEGLFCVKDYCNHGHIGSYTLITPQGKLYFAQLKELRNSVYKVAVWSRAAVLLNITEIAIRYFKIFCSVSQILFEFLSSCADKSSESHDGLPPVSQDVRSTANILVLL
ncbi:BRO family protein [Holdemania massiliensis]|uniref:BRO family protein n=1 Tax=Holdemania massiliensis TaxID=1468449 RepID=UPI0002F7D872